MKMNRKLSAAVGFAAAGLAWWNHRSQRMRAREAQFDRKSMQEALRRFEGEGGLLSTEMS